MRMTPREILIEFGKGCTCGKAGECEECLDGALRALRRSSMNKLDLILCIGIYVLIGIEIYKLAS